jgi:hypothetical protein
VGIERGLARPLADGTGQPIDSRGCPAVAGGVDRRRTVGSSIVTQIPVPKSRIWERMICLDGRDWHHEDRRCQRKCDA